MEARDLLLVTALRHAIGEPTIELGFERFAALTGSVLDYAAFCTAVADCQRDGLIRDPVRLPEGSLQCHWRLELTRQGIAQAGSVLPTDHAATL